MVEWRKIGDICQLERGVRVVKKDLQEEGNIPVFQNSLTPLGFYEDSNYPGNTPFVICAGAAGEIGYSNKAFWAADDCTCIVCTPLTNSKYVYYYLMVKQHILKSQVRKASVPRLSKEVISKLQMPVPPLSEQNRIVGILDTFTASIENLKQQIAERRKQYEYYRDQLLDLEEKDGVEFKSLKEIVKSYCTGATPKKGTLEYYEGGTVPWLKTQDVKFNEIYAIDSYVTNEAVEKTGIKWIPANCVIIAISGATAGRCAINKIPTTTNQHCLNLEINPEEALYKYVYYCVYNAYDKMISRKQGVRGDLNSSIILSIKIPVPSIQEQSCIVSILDTFEASIANLEAQLKQREKQYEYYRNKLLTFE